MTSNTIAKFMRENVKFYIIDQKLGVIPSLVSSVECFSAKYFISNGSVVVSIPASILFIKCL